MSQTIKIGTTCFVLLNGRTYAGVVVEFGHELNGPTVRVETEAAGVWRRPWKCLNFYMQNARAVVDRHVELIVPRDAEHLAQLEHDVANPPLDARMQWLARQAGMLPLEHVPQFPRGLEAKEKALTSDGQ